MATIDLGKIKQVWRGTYNNGTAYTVDDVVAYTDSGITSSYICVANSTGNAPSSSGTAHASWNYLAKGTAAAEGLKNSGSNQTVWFDRSTSNVSIGSTSLTEVQTLSIPTLSASCFFMVTFTEERREISWNSTMGQYQYSTDNGSNYTSLSYTDSFWDQTFGASSRVGGARGASIYQTHSGTFMIAFSSGQTPKFRINGKKFGTSNNYYANEEGESSIIAVKVEV
mgnify:CR=1 FL=1